MKRFNFSNRIWRLLIICAAAVLVTPSFADTALKTVKVFDTVIFYDGNDSDVKDSDVADNVLRHKNSRYAVKLEVADFSDLGTDLKLDVTIGALYDNYYRIGNVNLAFVDKGADSYDYESVPRI